MLHILLCYFKNKNKKTVGDLNCIPDSQNLDKGNMIKEDLMAYLRR